MVVVGGVLIVVFDVIEDDVFADTDLAVYAFAIILHDVVVLEFE